MATTAGSLGLTSSHVNDRASLMEMRDPDGKTFGWAVQWPDWTVTAWLVQLDGVPGELGRPYDDLADLRGDYPGATLMVTG